MYAERIIGASSYVADDIAMITALCDPKKTTTRLSWWVPYCP